MYIFSKRTASVLSLFFEVDISVTPHLLSGTIRIISSLLLITMIPAWAQSDESGTAYRLTELAQGIQVEVFDSAVMDENKYTADNSIYIPGREYVYRFEHIDERGRIFYIQSRDSLRTWHFVPVKEANPIHTIKFVKLTAIEGLGPFKTVDPGYNQTVILYSYTSEAGWIGSGEMTGIIENRANVWMHPPREGYFEILELNPFPYIKAPLAIGTTWSWKLTIGDGWSDPRWKSWKGRIESAYTYQIKGVEVLETRMGKLTCFRVESKAESRLGITGLTSWFNPDYGFVRLHYTNIDGSRTQLELDQMGTN